MSRRALVLAGPALVTSAVWDAILRNGFVFDDLVHIVGNPWIKGWCALPGAFFGHAAGFDPGNAEYRRNSEADRRGDADR